MKTEAATEYRSLPLSSLTESKTNPRRIFEDAALKELANSIRVHGVFSPLLVRPISDEGFEIVAGARRYRAAQMADAATVPVRVVNLTDVEALEAQLIENLQRRDVHPLEEAQSFQALLNLDEPKYSIEQIAAKVGKAPAYVAQRLKLTELCTPVVEAFYAEEIGVGHALLLAKLQPDQQETALAECFQEEWAGAGKKPKRILLPVRHLQQWIEQQLMLILGLAPFNQQDGQLVPGAGNCADCPKRTGHNKLLFADFRDDACLDPTCYQAKVAAHVAKALVEKPKLVQISTAYGQQPEGSVTLPRNKYTEIRSEKPESKDEAARPEFKTCKHTTEAIISEGFNKGELRKVCASADCPVHHPKKQGNADDAKWKAEQEKQRRQEAIARATGLRVLGAIGDAVPVRLLKRELLFIALQLAGKLDLQRIETLANLHRLPVQKGGETVAQTVAPFLRSSGEGTLGRLLVEMAILLRADSESAGSKVLGEAAKEYGINVDSIAAAVNREFAERDKNKTAKKTTVKAQARPAKKTTAA